jgi:hypothetical protein
MSRAVYVADVIQVVAASKFSLINEKRLQSELADAFSDNGLEFEREHRLEGSRNVVDFMFPGVLAVEVKLRQAKASIYRQLQRYAKHPSVEKILLISNTPMGLPTEIHGKPSYFWSVGSAWL